MDFSPPNLSPRDRLLHDARATHDVATLHLEPIATDDHVWMVIGLTPAHNSGTATVVGASVDIQSGQMVDAKTGKPLAPGGAPTETLEEGSWTLIAALNGPAANQGKYSWTKPRPLHAKGPEAQDFYAPFSKGGVVLCRSNPGAGSAQFEPVCLIPPSWQNAVKPAYEDVKKQPAPFREPPTPALRARLAEMLHGENPLLAILAGRRLIETQPVDPDRLVSFLATTDGPLRAASIYILLTRPEPVDEGMLAAALRRSIDDAKAVDDLKPIALGIFTAKLLHPDLPASRSLCGRLLSTLRAQSKPPRAGRPDTDAYLSEVFKLMGVAD